MNSCLRMPRFYAILLALGITHASGVYSSEVDRTVIVSGGQTGNSKQGVGFGHLTEPAHVLTLNIKAPTGRQITVTEITGAGVDLWRYKGEAGHNNTPDNMHSYEIIATAEEEGGDVPGDFEDVGHAVLFKGRVMGGAGGAGPSEFELAVAEIDLLAPGVSADKEHSEDTAGSFTLGLVTNDEKKKVTVRVGSMAPGNVKLTGFTGVTMSLYENGPYTASLEVEHFGDVFDGNGESTFDFWVQVDSFVISTVVATFEPDSGDGTAAVDKLTVTGGELTGDVFVPNLAIRTQETKQLACSFKNLSNEQQTFQFDVGQSGQPALTISPAEDNTVVVPAKSWVTVTFDVHVPAESGLGKVLVVFMEQELPLDLLGWNFSWGHVGVYHIEITDIVGNTLTGNQETIVGKKVDLEAIVNAPNSTITDGKWVITGDTVKSYVLTMEDGTSTGLATGLDEADLIAADVFPMWIESNIKYYWIEGATENARFDVTYEFKINGVSQEETLRYKVERPDSSLTSSTTAHDPPIGIRTAPNEYPYYAMAYGAIDDPLAAPGIRWTGDVTTPVDGNGEIAFLQLIKGELRIQSDSPPFPVFGKTSNGDSCLDRKDEDVVFYGSDIVAIGSSENRVHVSNDSPGIGLNDNKHVSFDYEFELYLMYKPDGADSIWVTLRKLDWYCSGSATKVGVFSMDDPQSSPDRNDPPEGEDTSELPQWQAWFQKIPIVQIN